MENKRKVKKNQICSEEKLKLVNKDNLQLGYDFIDYLSSIDRSPTTIAAYKNDLNIFWVWVYENLDNKFFIDLKKRDIVKFQNYCLNEYQWSPARLRRVKACLSSLSNYIENILDDEYDDFRPIIKKIESPANVKVMEKTVFKKEQLQYLLDVLVEREEYDKACMLACCMSNGRRKSELPRLKLSYFTEENLLYGSLYKTPETIKTKGRTSKGKQLTVYTLKNSFQKYLDLWVEYRKEHNITSDWLIPKKVNGEYIDEPITIEVLNRWAEYFTKILEVPFYWHSLRHYFTTLMYESNIPDSVIKDIVGWDSVEMCILYNDQPVDHKFEKYFTEDGIKQVEEGKLTDL